MKYTFIGFSPSLYEILKGIVFMEKKNIDNRLGIVLAISFFVIYLIMSTIFGMQLHKNKAESNIHHAERMGTETDVEYTEGDFTEVKVGLYVDSLTNINIAESEFGAVFYLWFAWEGDKDLNPGGNFQFVGGEIDPDGTSLVSEHYDGTSNYQRYKVTATFNKTYDLARVSLEDHLLNIYMEDTTRDSAKLRYVPDLEQTNISSRAKIPGFNVGEKVQLVTKPHVYRSTYSSPGADGDRVFSQLIVGIPIQRSDLGFYMKIVLPFYLSVALALMALWSHKTGADALGLSGAAFFGVVANAYVVNSIVPSNGGSFGILDMINIGSLTTVLMAVLVSIIALTIRSKDENSLRAKHIENYCFYSILVGYVIFNIVVPISASSI